MQGQGLVARRALLLAQRAKRQLSRRPLLAKAMPCAFGFAFGDFLTQYVNRDRSAPYRQDFRKTAAMAAAGAALAAPVGLGLYRAMDAAWPSVAFAVAAGKFTLDQVVGCAIWQAAYCALPGNGWYRDMLSSAAAAAAGGVDARVRDAVAYAAAMTSMVLPAPSAC
ncbi:hypothetical protein Rsub_04471 [Raphidocelis subcapitata]|uniref:Uncharacterized protein n=1 Tax=Raphidocelis subcapitata TaxID=307507 RepID=A0A2V0NWV7_9CHLO|nr:hypothetical protein Rsub_04471 [Raphidocelis subcapitata]|eukprot:GBF92124.1 hypothetical protein Rsub_04471 [Raphidocelis subcapitata]